MILLLGIQSSSHEGYSNGATEGCREMVVHCVKVSTGKAGVSLEGWLTTKTSRIHPGRCLTVIVLSRDETLVVQYRCLWSLAAILSYLACLSVRVALRLWYGLYGCHRIDQGAPCSMRVGTGSCHCALVDLLPSTETIEVEGYAAPATTKGGIGVLMYRLPTWWGYWERKYTGQSYSLRKLIKIVQKFWISALWIEE